MAITIKRLVSLLLFAAIMLSFVSITRMNAAATDELPIIKYNDSEVAVLKQIGSFNETTMAGYTGDVYLAALPYGAEITAIDCPRSEGLTNYFGAGANCLMYDSNALDTIQEQLIYNEQFTDPTFIADHTYSYDGYGDLYNWITFTEELPTRDVKGFAVYDADFATWAGDGGTIVFIQISTVPVLESYSLEAGGITISFNATTSAISEQIGSFNETTMAGYTGDVYLAALPYGAEITAIDCPRSEGLTNYFGAGASCLMYDSNALDTIQEQLIYNEQFTDPTFIADHTYSYDGYGDLYNWITFTEELPTRDVKGFAVYDADFATWAGDGGTIVFIQISTAGEVPVVINKQALDSAIKCVTGENAKNYYQSGDRYNGQVSDTISDKTSGFWAELTASDGPLATAQAINENVNATQKQVDEACATLFVAINKLIPITQINATALYEAVHETYYWWDGLTPGSQLVNPTGIEEANASNCTQASWNAYEEALSAANVELEKLFDENGNATDYNQSGGDDVVTEAESAVSAALSQLEQAVAGLDHLGDGGDLMDAQFAYKQLTILSRRVFNASALTSSDYTDESWSSFRSATDAAAAFLADHSVPAAPIGKKEVQEYRDAYSTFWHACFVGLSGTKSGNADIHIVDNYALRNGATPYENVGTYAFSIPAGGIALGDALRTAIGTDIFPWDDTGRGVGVYLNGVYLFDPDGSAENRPDSSVYAYRNVQLKDGDTVLIALTTLPTGSNLSGSVTISPYSELHDAIRYILLAQDGESISETSIVAGDALEITANTLCSSLMDYSGAAEPLAGATVYVSEAFPTKEAALAGSANQDSGVVTDADGSFSLLLPSAEGSDEGWYVVNLLAQSEYGGLTNGTNLLVHVTDPDDLTALKLNLKQRLEEVYAAFEDSFYTEAQLTEINALYSEGLAGIEKASNSGDANAAFKTAYDGITAIQAANEKATEFNLNAVRELLDYLPSAEDLEAGKLYDVDRPVLDLLFNADGWFTRMTDYQKSDLSGSEAAILTSLKTAYENADNGSTLPAIPAFTVKVEVRDVETGELVDLPLMDDGNFSYLTVESFDEETGHFVWGWSDTFALTRGEDAGTFLLPTEGGYVAALNIGVDCGDSSVYDYDHWSEESFKSDVPEHYDFDNDNTTFHTLRQNVTIIRYVHHVNALDGEREAAISTLENAYQSYEKTNYTAENWNTLESEYLAGLRAIKSAETAAEIDAALNNALEKMAGVKKRAEDDYGIVTVTVRNDTYLVADGAPWDGALVESVSVALNADSTMMSCILEALDDYEVIGGENNYISEINNLAEFDGGRQSGWMGNLNDWFTNEGFTSFSVANGKLHDGDVICVEYTCAFGADIRGGTEGNTNTTLYALSLTNGTLFPAFDTIETKYVFLLNGGANEIKIVFTNNNRSFQSRAYLNNYMPTANNWISSGDVVPVSGGDTLFVGVGEPVWPSMGRGNPTKYQITMIASDSCDAVEKLIDDIGSITSTNYRNKQAPVALARAAYDALTDTAKANVDNYATLTAAEEAIAGYEAVDALKAEIAALPGSVTLTVRDAVETAKAHYDALTDAQRNLLTVAETNKLLKAVNTLAVLDALAAIEDTKDFASTEANTQAAVRTALETWLNNADAAVVVDRFTAAMDGTAENLSGTAGSYSATVTVTIGSGAVAASGEKTVTGSITPMVYVKSSDTGVQSIKVNGVPATGFGTAYAAVLPYGSDMATASFEIVPADKATASAPETNDGGETWTFTVTAEDGTTAEYTVTLSVNSVVVTVLECGIYTVTPDVTVTELSPAAVSGLLEAVSTDALDLPQGTESVALWLSVTATAKDGEDITLRIEPIYAADDAEGQAVPAAALIGQITVTLPIPGTEYSKVLTAGEYLDAEGTESGITFTITAAGEYTLIPDAHIAAVTWHLNGGTSAVVTDGQQTIYFRSDDGADLPEAEKSGFTFKGWHSEDNIDSVAYIAVSAQLPADLYAVWQSGNVNAAVTVSGVSAVKSGSVYTVTLPYGSDYPKAADISITPEDAAATYTKPMTGDDGASWSFTVTAEDGTRQEYTLQVVIAEQTAEDILAAAKETIEGADWNTEQQTANDAASLKAFVENKLAALDLGAAYTVTVTSVTPAVAGDAEDTQGTAGSYSFTVTLTAGEASETAAGSGSISATAYVAPAQQADYITALNAVLPYLRSTVTNPIVGSTYGEWAVLALNRGDAATEAWNNIYLSNLKAYVDQKNGVLAEKNYTEYSRVILALTSMGVDATKFATESGTYDLVKPLLDKQASGEYWAEWQGNNGTAFALLAADSHDYLDTAEGKALRAGLIASLKANQMASGAWAISGTSSPDLDVTAAAIYALAPYYLDSSRLSALGGTVSYAEVQAMVDSALAYLSGQQNADGGFGSVEADVWAIIALSTLGRDADTDPAFVKNGKSLLADMLSYQEESSGAFRHLLSGSVDQMATEEAAYGLVAYDRFKNGSNTLYDMSDVEIASLDEKANKAAAEELEALIDAIGEVTLESKAKIDAARAAYDALTDEQKALVGNLQTLKDAEAKYQELAEAADQEEIDKAAAKGVDELIDAIGEVTLDSEKAIKAARNAYDALTDEQKKLVEKLADLKAAEAKLEELQPLVTVTFYLQSGKSSEVAEGETKTYTKADDGKALPTASRDDYSFDGWYDASTGGTRYTSVSAALPRELYAQWTSDSSGGSGGEGDSDEGKITVTMRLIGAKQAEKDVDLGAEEYMPDYVTWIATTSYKLEEGSSVYDLWIQVTGDAGIRSVGAEKNYVSAVFAPSSLGGYELAEFTNGKRSGWMYTINGRHPGFGLKEQELHDGDRVIWHYVNDYSYEVSDWFEADSRWPSLGDGRYYNRWLKAPDRFGGSGGGLGEGAQSSGGSGDSSGGSSEIIPSYDGDTIVIKADVEHSEGGAAYAADATLDKKTVAEGLEKAEDKSSLKVWVDIEDSNRLVLRIEPEAMKEIADAKAGLRMECSRGVIKLDADAVAKLTESGHEVRMVVSYDDWNDKTTVSVRPFPPTDGDAAVMLKIELPATKDGQALSIVGSDGTTTPIKKSAIIGDRVYAEVPSGVTLTITESDRYWNDVKAGDWFADAVSFAVSHDLMNGVDRYEFAPNMPMTRAMLVTVLYRLEDEPEIAGSMSFGDVASGAWYTEAVAWAAEQEIVRGNGDGFAPNDNITREQIATVLYRYAQYLGMDVEAKGDVSKFSDGEKISSWAQDAMAWAVKVGLFKGDDTGSLNPQGNATRAEVATLLERLIKLIVVS